MKLTKTTASEIPAPADRFEVRVFDEDLPGFGVRVLSGGKRSWIIQYRIKGRSTTSTIGRFEKMSVGTARDLAKKKLAQAELGIDPGKEKQTARHQAAETFETIAGRFLRAKEGQVKPSSYDQINSHLTKHWATFNSRSIHDIARRDIAARLGEIAEERGPFAANRARATLSNFYSWAMKEGLLDELDSNPVIATNRQTDEKARDRVLSDAEIVEIWNSCNDDDYGRIVRLLILTAQRRDEVGAIARPEANLKERKWTIPGARTKNGLTHEVPLSDRSIAVLKQAMARAGREEREAIFGESDGGYGFSGWSKAKAALDERIKKARDEKLKSVKDEKRKSPWRVHDIRRTAATRMGDLGVLPHVVEAVLNHISGHKKGVAGTYNRSLYAKEKRQALDLWAAHVEALLAGKPASNVVPMKA